MALGRWGGGISFFKVRYCQFPACGSRCYGFCKGTRTLGRSETSKRVLCSWWDAAAAARVVGCHSTGEYAGSLCLFSILRRLGAGEGCDAAMGRCALGTIKGLRDCKGLTRYLLFSSSKKEWHACWSQKGVIVVPGRPCLEPSSCRKTSARRRNGDSRLHERKAMP